MPTLSICRRCPEKGAVDAARGGVDVATHRKPTDSHPHNFMGAMSQPPTKGLKTISGAPMPWRYKAVNIGMGSEN